MSKFLFSTAVAALLALPVAAQTATDAPAADATTTTAPADTMTTTATTDAATGFGYVAAAGDMSAETFLGKRLYVAEQDVDANAQYTEIDEGWDDIGEIGDLILGADGQVKAVLVDIGGFLGLGERQVAVAMEQLSVIRDGDSEDDYFIVFTSDRATLDAAPEFEWATD